MSRLCRLAVWTVAVAVGGVLAACGGSGTDATVSAGSLRAAAENTQSADSAEFSLSLNVDTGDRHTTVTGSGATSADGRHARLRIDLPGAGTIEARIVDGTAYADLGSLLGGAVPLPAGKRWVKISPDDLGRLAGEDLSGLLGGAGNPASEGLEYLQGLAGNVEKVGDDTVAGRHATHYRASIDYAKLADELPGVSDQLKEQLAKLGTVPADVWLDDQDRVVRFRIALNPAASGQGGHGSIELTVEITAFGTPVDVEAPSPDQVISLPDVLGGLGATRII
jgi:hypothetical protein